jgi:hypothetical protein
MLAYRGVAYDTGSNFATGQGELSRTEWSTPTMLAEISLISDQLNCNSVTIYGSDLGRLAETATAAVERGLHVWLDPRWVDRPHGEILDHLAEVARLAESLRKEGASISLTVGAAHTIFTPGIVAGETYHERMANIYADAKHFLLTPTATVDVPASAPRLNEFLARASTVGRGIFNGEISYSAAPFEDADWGLFDLIGLMYYYSPVYRTPGEHIAELARYARWNKPIVIAGFGTATYRGAEQKACFFWDIVDRSEAVPKIVDGYVRDESAQAAYHLKMFDIFERAGMHGVIVTELIHPTHPHSTDPRLDLDMASMCIVKSIRDDITDPTSAYRREPKESFHAIADHYAKLGFQEVA